MADARGLYAVQGEVADPHNLRGIFTTDETGRYSFATIRPTPYPVPTDGPAGELFALADRHSWRPAHIHYRVEAPGHVGVTMHVFDGASAYLDSDAVFGVRNSLIRPFVADAEGVYRATFDIVLTPLCDLRSQTRSTTRRGLVQPFRNNFRFRLPFSAP